MAELKEWAVELEETTNHLYTVLARTAEEAESLAEDLFDSGDEGTIDETSVTSVCAMSGTSYADVEEFDGEEVEIEFES